MSLYEDGRLIGFLAVMTFLVLAGCGGPPGGGYPDAYIQIYDSVEIDHLDEVSKTYTFAVPQNVTTLDILGKLRLSGRTTIQSASHAHAHSCESTLERPEDWGTNEFLCAWAFPPLAEQTAWELTLTTAADGEYVFGVFITFLQK